MIISSSFIGYAISWTATRQHTQLTTRRLYTQANTTQSLVAGGIGVDVVVLGQYLHTPVHHKPAIRQCIIHYPYVAQDIVVTHQTAYVSAAVCSIVSYKIIDTIK